MCESPKLFYQKNKMKLIHTAIFNFLVLILCHLLVFYFLKDNAIKAGACGMGLVMLAGWFFIAMNVFYSLFPFIYLISAGSKKQNYETVFWLAFFGITGNLFVSLFLNYVLWTLLIIPYLLFIGESLYLKYFSQQP